jgi:hypothetical protein
MLRRRNSGLRRWNHAILLLCLAGMLPAASGQPPSHPSGGRSGKTFLDVVLLAAPDGGALHSQDWRSAFEQLDVPVSIRRPVLDDKPEVKERTVGTLRYVTVVGVIDRQGRLVFADRTFTRGEAAKLKEWLDELTTYGAQGSPKGQPLWGLSKPQFEALYLALAEVHSADLSGQPLSRAVAALEISPQYPLRWSSAATDVVQKLGDEATVRQHVVGFSKATTLAIALNDRGLGFRPNRTPSGGIELVIEPQTENRHEHWPVGWPLQRPAPQALPGLFVLTNIQLQKEPLADVLEAVTDLTEAPVFVDYAGFAQRQLDLAALRATHPLKKTTWSLALRAILVPQKLNREYWQDEAGKAFVWITPIGKERTNGAASNPADAP